jgi:hypothetical protein
MKLGMVVAGVLMCAAAGARADLSDTAWGRQVHWTPPGKYAITLHVVATALILLDGWQSLDIKNHMTPLPEGGFSKQTRMTEQGPIAMIWGSNPTDLQFIGTTLVMAGITTAVWYVLPSEIRWLTDVAVIYVEGPVVYRNATKWGLRLTIPFS